VRRPLSRREMLGIMAGLGVAGCDAKQPKAGMLGRMERVNKRVESFLLSDKEITAGDITPPMAFPSYHVAPGIPVMPVGWRLIVSGTGVAKPLALTLDELMKLPSKTFRIEHHCVEGWSAIAEWTGVPLYEVARLAGLKDTSASGKDIAYVEFRSFDVPRGWNRGYWSSWDRASALHPQTLLAYGMNGKPLTPAYGAPLKVYSPVKLGYKNVKYLSEVNFLDVETGGYWENSGYEWFGGV
jgi:DMSO/TMAO reductase YedYZ molybdopterin-dependent catalytic subunit